MFAKLKNKTIRKVNISKIFLENNKKYIFKVYTKLFVDSVAYLPDLDSFKVAVSKLQHIRP